MFYFTGSMYVPCSWGYAIYQHAAIVAAEFICV